MNNNDTNYTTKSIPLPPLRIEKGMTLREALYYQVLNNAPDGVPDIEAWRKEAIKTICPNRITEWRIKTSLRKKGYLVRFER